MRYILYCALSAIFTSLVAAGTFNSPTAGQTLHIGQPFSFSWDSSLLPSESTESVTVLLAVGSLASADRATRLIEDLAPTSINGTSASYSASLNLSLFYESPPGNYQLVVLEKFKSYLVRFFLDRWTRY
ncbi:hypothetical protein CPB85DRAFT_886573 [Mucidula mucida]|nr:hypothetical protein CPB85DRAFT_886573 [Mucidula mucida]